MEVGYKVFRADAERRLTLTSERFSIEPELTIKAARLGVRMYEVPIGYDGRTCAERKKMIGRDGERHRAHSSLSLLRLTRLARRSNCAICRSCRSLTLRLGDLSRPQRGAGWKQSAR
jgi:hypothetical protein